MTIKIEAWQDRGIKKDKCIDKFEFCCWMSLKIWLNRPNIFPHLCPKCALPIDRPKKEKK